MAKRMEPLNYSGPRGGFFTFDPHCPRYRRRLAWIALVFGALPLVASVPYYFLVRMFLPAPSFGVGVVPVAVIWAVVGLLVFAPMAFGGDRVTLGQQLLLLLMGPGLTAAIGVMAWVGPVPYLLHVASESQAVEVVSTVASLGHGASKRNCGNGVELSTGVGVFPHKVCFVPDPVFRTLGTGDRVVVEGQASRFGLLGHTLRPYEPNRAD
jgi:hypothetical protein